MSAPKSAVENFSPSTPAHSKQYQQKYPRCLLCLLGWFYGVLLPLTAMCVLHGTGAQHRGDAVNSHHSCRSRKSKFKRGIKKERLGVLENEVFLDFLCPAYFLLHYNEVLSISKWYFWTHTSNQYVLHSLPILYLVKRSCSV